MENAKVAQAKVDQRHPGTNYMIPQGISVRPHAKEKRKKFEPRGQARIKIWKHLFACTTSQLQVVEVLTAQTHLGTSPDVHAKFDPHATTDT